MTRLEDQAAGFAHHSHKHDSEAVFLAVGDFNKDRESDVAVTNRQSNDVSVFLGQ